MQDANGVEVQKRTWRGVIGGNCQIKDVFLVLQTSFCMHSLVYITHKRMSLNDSFRRVISSHSTDLCTRTSPQCWCSTRCSCKGTSHTRPDLQKQYIYDLLWYVGTSQKSIRFYDGNQTMTKSIMTFAKAQQSTSLNTSSRASSLIQERSTPFHMYSYFTNNS